MDPIRKQFVFLKGIHVFSVRLDAVMEVTENISYDPTNTLGEAIIGLMEYKDLPIPILDPSQLAEIHSNHNVEYNKSEKGTSCVIVSDADWKLGILLDQFYKIIPLASSTDNSDHSKEADSETDNSLRGSFIESISLLDKRTLYNLNVSAIIQSLRKKIGNQIVSVHKKTIAIQSDLMREEGNISKCLCFLIGDIQFGIPIQEVVEVVDNQLVTPLFKVSPYLRGLINVRGKIYPCVDISNHLKMPYRPLNENTKFIILKHDLRELAICCDSISSMKDLSNKIIQNNEGLLEKSLNQISFGIANYQNETVLIVSSRAIIDSDELAHYRKGSEE